MGVWLFSVSSQYAIRPFGGEVQVHENFLRRQVLVVDKFNPTQYAHLIGIYSNCLLSHLYSNIFHATKVVFNLNGLLQTQAMYSILTTIFVAIVLIGEPPFSYIITYTTCCDIPYYFVTVLCML